MRIENQAPRSLRCTQLVYPKYTTAAKTLRISATGLPRRIAAPVGVLLGFWVELVLALVVVPALVLDGPVLDADVLFRVAELIVVLRSMTVPVAIEPPAPLAPLAKTPVPGSWVVIETVALPAEVVVVTRVLLLPPWGTGTGIGTMGVMPEEADDEVEDEMVEDDIVEDDAEEEMTPVVAGRPPERVNWPE